MGNATTGASRCRNKVDIQNTEHLRITLLRSLPIDWHFRMYYAKLDSLHSFLHRTIAVNLLRHAAEVFWPQLRVGGQPEDSI